MVFPTTVYDGFVPKQNCPKGFLHVPHLFYETYWNTIAFKDRWTPNQGAQPFVLSNGDLSGCSGHGDFLAAWDPAVLQGIIDTCDAGDIGMDHCPGVTVRDQSASCHVASPVDEVIKGKLSSLPGSNPLAGWGVAAAVGGGGGVVVVSPVPGSASSSSPPPSSSSAAAPQAASPSEYGETTTPPPLLSVAAAQTMAAAVVPADEDAVASSAPPTTTTTTAVTTLPDGRVVTTTVVNWVTVTKWAAEAVPVATQTVAAKNHAHAHAHVHALRHRSDHGQRK